MPRIKVKGKTKYISQTTPEGNSSFSFLSQEEADKRAAALDAKGCVDCIECIACVDCDNCFNCTYCDDCVDCTGVSQLAGEEGISQG